MGREFFLKTLLFWKHGLLGQVTKSWIITATLQTHQDCYYGLLE